MLQKSSETIVLEGGITTEEIHETQSILRYQKCLRELIEKPESSQAAIIVSFISEKCLELPDLARKFIKKTF